MDLKPHSVAMLGCFDTKGSDFSFLHSCLTNLGLEVLPINLGVKATNVDFPVTISATKIASEGGSSLDTLRTKSDRNLAIEVMGRGAAAVLKTLQEDGKIVGAIGMGGGGGTHMILRAMQSLSFGLPKICLSTLAGKDLSDKMLAKDIVLMPSLVDVAGLNKISRTLIGQAAGALAGMLQIKLTAGTESRGTIAISMFGNTTACVNQCSHLLQAAGYEVLPFHAVGTGGKTMEALIREGLIDGVLDLTTTELADNLCGGICSAGPDRLTAAGEKGIPQVIAPGCLDMVNFGTLESVPERYQDRLLYSWAPDVTLMRTTVDENTSLGEEIAFKVNPSKGESRVLLPKGGISLVSLPGEVFHDPEADTALFDAISENLHPEVLCLRLHVDINDPQFAETAVENLLEMLHGVS